MLTKDLGGEYGLYNKHSVFFHCQPAGCRISQSARWRAEPEAKSRGRSPLLTMFLWKDNDYTPLKSEKRKSSCKHNVEQKQ